VGLDLRDGELQVVAQVDRNPGFLLTRISLGCTRKHVCVCELVLVQAHKACLQRRARATRRPARRWYRHGAAGWAALGAGDGLALTTCLQSALWRTWRQNVSVLAPHAVVVVVTLLWLAEATRANYRSNVLCSNNVSSALERLKSANDLCTSDLRSCRGIGWVTFHEHILLPLSTTQPHTLPSLDSKATQIAKNKERLCVCHDIVWCRTMRAQPEC
jgi:hypothetical protein